MKNPMKYIDAFFAKPLLIEEGTLRMIIAAMNVRADLPAPQAASRGADRNVVQIRSEIAVIPVFGILTHRGDYWSYLFDETSYEEIRRHFRQALGDPAVSAIVLDVASPGGTVEGLFDLVDEIHQSRGVKPVYAMINESAHSGAYAIASAAEKVFIPRTGRAGSIGVLAVHVDESAANEAAGLKYTEIYAGARKVDGTSLAPLSEEARAAYQKYVDQTYDLFVETVARNRGLKTADVRAQQAAIYTGREAVSAGLADAVLSWEAAWKKILGTKNNQGGSMMKTKLQALFQDAPKEAVAQALSEMGWCPNPEQGAVVLSAAMVPVVAAAFGVPAEQLAGDPAGIDFKALREQALREAVTGTRKETLAYVRSILEVCALGGQDKMALALIGEEAGIEAAREKVLAAKAKEADTTHIRSTIGGLSADGVNPVIADAKKRAGVS